METYNQDKLKALLRELEKNKEAEQKAISQRRASEGNLLTAIIDLKQFQLVKINYSAFRWEGLHTTLK